MQTVISKLRSPTLGTASVGVSKTVDALLPVFAVLAALAVGAVMLMVLGANPVEAYGALIEGAFGSTNAVAETAVKAVPLLLVGLGICIAFRGNVINIGGEGQMIIGAILGTLVGLNLPDWPGWVVIPLALLGGFVGGAVWGGIPGVLKAYFDVNEILILSDRIAVIYEGQIMGVVDGEDATPEQLGLLMTGVKPESQVGVV